ncbi:MULTISPECIES: ABC transporter permease [Haloarcula]|uniref:ABC transporter permease n=1 Tax=Haloarcula hispanica TaxID=51589 RepID=A0A5J5LHI1_HALHI|nr:MULTISPECIES: ABC transporter permease [Haloarcula]AJF25928.1 hypothetical protein SG26_09435 [Haloarcula sp. CBA1115]KAA9405435.1 ABC transporter permease [Haloarcula sp. CBA1131]KAA9408685.1 ABC transporter permease [Haloarcula hispanica]KZX49792.1 hypothetical protein AV929_14895 [Haloarcula sp. K1]MUV50367.1 ABC transporter permease subunit [Haloarcula sp. CBA1122]
MSPEQNPVKRFISDVDTSIKNSEFADWYPIVKKEFADMIRTRAVLVLAIIFLTGLVLFPIIALYSPLGSNAKAASGVLNLVVTSPRVLSVIIPIAAIGFTYTAISGERERGSLKILMSLPYTRKDVIIGKLIGRYLSIATTLVVIFVLQILVFLPEAGSDIALGFYSKLYGLTLVLALTFIGFSLGASAATATAKRSLMVAAGIFLYLFALWGRAARGTGSLLQEHANVASATSIKIELFLKLLNPTRAYQVLVQSTTNSEATVAQVRAQMVSGGILSAGREQQAFNILEGAVPWYLSDPFAFVILLAWCIVPLAIGYQLFNGADL